MPKGSSGLSAVARKRLRHVNRPTSNDSDSQSGASTAVKRAGELVDESLRRSTRSQRSLSHGTDSTSGLSEIQDTTENQGGINSFAGISSLNQASLEPGKLDELSHGRLKALSGRGKKLFIVGSYQLWVKSGAVALYGAIITPSESVYRVYAPISYSVPTIEVVSEAAEIELSALDDGIKVVTERRDRGLWESNTTARSTGSTLLVLGHHFTMEASVVPQYELNLTPWNPVIGQLLPALPSADRSRSMRTIVMGRRSSGSTTFTRCLVNRLLTTLGRAEQSRDPEVVVLDLNPESPTCTLPGTMALLKIKEPVFGPAFTHSNPARKILKMHFIGNTGSTATSGRLEDIMMELIEQYQLHLSGNCPVVVHLPASAHFDTVKRLCNALGVSNMVQMESGPSVHESMTAIDNVSLWRATSPSIDSRVSSTYDHDLRLQSYFHREQAPNRNVVWATEPLMALAGNWKTIRMFDDNDLLTAVVWLDALLDSEDTVDALLGDIGVVLSVSREYFNLSLRQQVVRQYFGLPRLALPTTDLLPPSNSECLGMAIVFEVGISSATVRVSTPISQTLLQADPTRVLVLMHLGKRNRHATENEWIAGEIENLNST